MADSPLPSIRDKVLAGERLSFDDGLALEACNDLFFLGDLANRVRAMLVDRNDWHRFPDDVSEWLEVQSERSMLPEPHQLLVETFPHEGRHYMVAYSFEGWNAHQSLGMLITKRMESAGMKPLGFVANEYALAVWGLGDLGLAIHHVAVQTISGPLSVSADLEVDGTMALTSAHDIASRLE